MDTREIRCQFCGQTSFAEWWKDDHCPMCKKKYDPQLAQDSEE